MKISKYCIKIFSLDIKNLLKFNFFLNKKFHISKSKISNVELKKFQGSSFIYPLDTRNFLILYISKNILESIAYINFAFEKFLVSSGYIVLTRIFQNSCSTPEISIFFVKTRIQKNLNAKNG